VSVPPHSARTEAPALAGPWLRWSLGAGLAAFAAYALLAPGVSGDKDGSEFTLVLATLGLAHPTGYPIYTVIGHGFAVAAHATGATWDRAANLWSALGGGVAIGVMHALAARLLRRGGVAPRAADLAALLPAAALALNPAWTLDTTLAEVNSWHLAWVAWAALVGVELLEAPGARARDAALWGLVCGLGLAHHRTSLFVIAPFSVALLLGWVRARRLDPRAIAAFAGAAAVPLASYAYVFWRADHPAAVQWSGMGAGAAGALRHIFGSEYLIYLGRFAPDDVQRRLIDASVYPWLIPALLAAVLWVWGAESPRAPARFALAATVFFGTGYAFSYGVPDPSSYFLPSLMLSLGVVPAAVALVPGARRRGHELGAIATLGAALALVAGLRYARARDAAYRDYDAGLHALWRSVPADSGFVLWPDDMVAHLVEYQRLAGEKPALEVLHPVELTQLAPRSRFIARHGFDPVPTQMIGARAREHPPRDVQELSALIAGAVADEINARSPLPVVWFDPAAGTARVLEKAMLDTTVTAPRR
jgi:hypothetical protein